ncbi:MAG: hypothetical protein C4589_09840 [Peptococcaceae bacterium]|nr:MAG: hypothetical protein C4589_09840 [Peptococcaceae bacterium]
MMQIDEIMNKIVELLEAYPGLGSVKKWHKVDGMIPAVHPCGSVNPVQEDFEQITRDKDESTVRFAIFVYLQHASPETGEQQVRELAHSVRLALTADNDNRRLAGVGGTTDSYVYSIKYMTIDASSTLLLHAAEIDYRVKYDSFRTV